MSYRSLLRPFLKRSFDIYSSVVLITLFSPLMLVIAIAIKLTSRGSIFFLQERYTRNMKKFRVIKFRTMEDGKVTIVGAVLRKYGLDEIAQLFNVLKGEMSLVGPRAHWVQEANEILQDFPDYQLRFTVAAGITGIAQIYGYNINDVRSLKLAIFCDKKYCENPSLRRDLAILIGTVKILLLGQRY